MKGKSAVTAVAMAVFVCCVALAALTRSHALASIRPVDALLLFSAGVSVGVALARVVSAAART